MTEEEKIFAGHMFDPRSPELREIKHKAHEICRRYNQLDEFDPARRDLILDMLDERDDIRPYTDKLLRSMMEQLFLFLLRDHMDQLDIGKSLRKHDDTILTILRYIQKHFTGITLAALAHHFNYSEAYLSYLIKAYTGSTFSQTVTELRLQQVAHGLKVEKPL